MRKSLESSQSSTRPILPKNKDGNNYTNTNNRASTRFSTYSVASSALDEKSSAAMSNAADSEVQKYANSLDRMESKRLQDQRYTPSTEKDEDMSKLALGAKVQRALDRRYSSQDAEYKPKPKKTSEKSGLAQNSR